MITFTMLMRSVTISAKKDSAKGGQKLLVGRGCDARNTCSTSEVHWTTLGFNAGNSKPVLCKIVFASVIIIVEERLGIDVFVPYSCDNSRMICNVFHQRLCNLQNSC